MFKMHVRSEPAIVRQALDRLSITVDGINEATLCNSEADRMSVDTIYTSYALAPLPPNFSVDGFAKTSVFNHLSVETSPRAATLKFGGRGA